MKFGHWIADQELPLIIGLVVLMLVGWGLCPVFVR